MAELPDTLVERDNFLYIVSGFTMTDEPQWRLLWYPTGIRASTWRSNYGTAFPEDGIRVRRTDSGIFRAEDASTYGRLEVRLTDMGRTTATFDKLVSVPEPIQRGKKLPVFWHNGQWWKDTKQGRVALGASRPRVTSALGGALGTQSMTYGTLPSFEKFEAAFDRVMKEDGSSRYRIRLGRSDSRAAEGTSIGDGEYTARELYKGVKELIQKGDEPAGDLASSIMSTLEFGWV